MKIQFLTRINLLLYGVCLTAMVLSAPVKAGVVEPALQQAMQDGEEISFIVHFHKHVDLTAFPGRGKGKGIERASLLWELRKQADSSQAGALELLKGRGAKRLIQLWSINSLAATADPEVIKELASLPGVGNVVLDNTLAAPSPEPSATATPEWNLDMIRAPEFWNTYDVDGTGTVVASMDTGVDWQHLDLADSYRGGSNSWFDPNGEHSTPYDKAGSGYSGHGTQVTSLMVGGDASGTSIGVAPGAQWIAVKIFNDAGLASLSAIHHGFQWLLDPDGNPATDDQPDVVNNSWGFPTLVGQCYTEFESDIQVLQAAGIPVVFSAGNQGTVGSVSPADNTSSFAVGAVDESEFVADFSSRGPSACDGTIFPQIVAPGVNVKAADLTAGGVFLLSYKNVSGTSFAAPHVSATMALLRKAFPAATVEQLEQALMDSVFHPYLDGPDNTYGYGVLDAVVANDMLTNPTWPTCTDSDSDGFFAEAGCGSELDCNDSDAGINPAACDIKGDGVDQDCDGVDRTKGKSCPVSDGGDTGTSDPDTGSSDPISSPEGKGDTCSDGIDNDNDGDIDCQDSGCSKNKSCKTR
ncbi:MAG: serine protease AprX [Desulforhopalus sp.]|jgi:serine protease AprX